MGQLIDGIHPKVAIVDFGSQYTYLIGRTLRELGFRSVIVSPQKVGKYLEARTAQALILSGGSASVYEENAPAMPIDVIKMGIPTLAICYGMQWIAHHLGGEVMAEREHKEYGEAHITVSNGDPLLASLPSSMKVWASHGDSVKKTPPGFSIIASSVGTGTIAAMSDPLRKIWGVQFHPEVTHTKFGKEILAKFLGKICGCSKDWEPSSIIQDIQAETVSEVGDCKVIGGFSGGVDSTTTMKILAPVLKNKLQAVCIDTGALRLNELREIRANAKAAGVKLRVINAAKKFQEALAGTADAEEKRQQFKNIYVAILERAAKDFGSDCEYLLQGTLMTDIIESGKVGEAAHIKSHHNVGLKIDLKELRPFRNLFKYEVRTLARQAGLPPAVTERHPFPGPGLFLRVVGQPVTQERLDVVRWADAEVTRIIRKHGLYEEISQLIIALICVPTVGIKGDGRSYRNSIVVRGVTTQDFMTVEGYQIPPEVRREISTVITTHPQVVRVWFDETNKPPATTEME